MKIISSIFIVFFLSYSPAFSADVSPQKIEGATTIDTTKAKQLFDQGALFVDVRRDSDWNNGRIPDALHLELKKVFSNETLLDEAKKDEPIIIYCNGEKCLRSVKATALAVEWGFKNIYFFRDGFPAWKMASFPVE
ncbi:MAG: rhodanese-like domain-containing protein [Methylococcaceae bacterium]|nr:rhodanese-like domain-containing protein [Methylococcaceae bacterium]